jgi:hypothetical protein
MQEDLYAVLEKSNSKREKPVDNEILKQIIALEIKNPLNEDRARCQEQIYAIVKQSIGRGKK